MATVEIKKPSILVLEFSQDKNDEDYGTCIWARFYFDKESYTLTIESDCGTYGYGWTPTPKSESFLKLMSGLDEEYLLKKISSMCQVNEKKTFENIKEVIANHLGFYDVDFSEVIVAGYLTDDNIDQIQSACNDSDEGYIYELLMSAINDIDSLCGIGAYEVIQAIESDYPNSAKKIASVFKKSIQPKIIEICKEEKEK